MAIFGRSAIVVDSGESCSVLAGSGGWRAVWCPNQFWAPGAQNPKIFFFENYFFQYSYNVKMRLSAIKSGDSYQIRAERILIPTLCPFWAPDSQFGHRVPNWAPNRPTSEKVRYESLFFSKNTIISLFRKTRWFHDSLIAPFEIMEDQAIPPKIAFWRHFFRIDKNWKILKISSFEIL